MSYEITVKAARDHLIEYMRLVSGLPKDIQSLELALASSNLRIKWRQLNFGVKIHHSTFEQIKAMQDEFFSSKLASKGER
jgi:hypothetical protein